MQKIFFLTLLLPLLLQAESRQVIETNSPAHRVALLELYTSEGCSSCPPAERVLSGLKEEGIHPNTLIPLAFHVTYWDYIGWKDSYAKKKFDERQRTIARHNSQRTIYTPQFVLSGKDYRRYKSFSDDISDLNLQTAVVSLSLRIEKVKADDVEIKLTPRVLSKEGEALEYYIAVSENNLVSDVTDGENEGETLYHDFVVRKLYGPFKQQMPDAGTVHTIRLKLLKEWKQRDLSIVAFAQDRNTGDILQAVKLRL